MNTILAPRRSNSSRTLQSEVGRVIPNPPRSSEANRHRRWWTTISIVAILAIPAGAQTGRTPDEQWATLKNFGRPEARPVAATKGEPIAKPTRAVVAAKFIGQANQLKTFYTEYSTHASAKEAKRLETLALAQAALNGETSQDARYAQLITEVRADPSLPAAKRFEAVAWSNQVGISRQKLKDRAAILAAQEGATRALIAEFPALPDGYESLAGLARDSAPARGATIARDLLGMSAAPAPIKVEAQRLLERYALIGRPIGSIFTQAGASALLPKDPPKVTVVYAWSKAAPPSLASVKRMAAQTPTAGFVGVCLDADITAARQTAATAQAPGPQYYHAGGATSPLASALKTGRTFTVYLVDRNGVIRDVQGRDDFTRKIAALNR